jgi:hypothetical protein
MKTSTYAMYISESGEYGSAYGLVTLEQGDLTEKQWENVAALEGRDRFDYVMACLDDDELEQAALLGEDA